MAGTARPRIYQLKIVLKEYHPAIWRTFYVADNTPLPRLHKILQIVMGWQNCHLHSFEHKGYSYGPDDPEGWEMLDNHRTEDRYTLRQIAMDVGSSFMYLYDMGDNWEHKVLVEDIVEPPPGLQIPICIDGRRACPPEDSHGPYGYKELLEAIGNPRHRDHRQMTEWLQMIGKEGFNPDVFNINQINEALRRVDDYFPSSDDESDYY